MPMMVREIVLLMGSWLAGLLLGSIFFGGLWLTIRYTLSSAALGVWLIGSFVLRSTTVLVGFYVVFAGEWQRLLACLLGFVLARIIIHRLLRPRHNPQSHAAPEVSHAP
jgi:F1F0 ATPase subunit 2